MKSYRSSQYNIHILGEQRRDDNEELATKTLRIQSKRYYVDVKQNNRGRFIKLVEVKLFMLPSNFHDEKLIHLQFLG